MNDLAESLVSAAGDSKFVIAVFLDVRGFSRFAGIAESVQAAVFLKKFYLGVLNRFLPGASFAKPTGDGLMVIYEYDEDSLRDVATTAVKGCLRLIDEYPKFLISEPMITFDVPPDIGIGIARDAATRMSSAEGTLDYSGRPLNLASRLMDLARPRGVVLDSYVATAVDKELLPGFSTEKVYLRGVAPDAPREVSLRADWTQLQEDSRHPLAAYEWFSEPQLRLSFKHLRERGTFQEPLTNEPAFADQIHVRIGHKKILDSGRPSRSVYSWLNVSVTYSDLYGKHVALSDYSDASAKLQKRGVKDTWEVIREVSYKIRKP